MTIDEYVVGHYTPSFCNLVESGTKPWANIQGATSFKFGVYFGKTKSKRTRKYRFPRKFGSSEVEAFASVKAALLDLLTLGGNDPIDFTAIDANPLSQMFKAKILSPYYPDRFLAVCSSEHLAMLADLMGFEEGQPSSRHQNLLLELKRSNSRTRKIIPGRSPHYVCSASIGMDGKDAALKLFDTRADACGCECLLSKRCG